ncbi:primosomal protein N' [Candidatus Margulisiibacteriota bacterium]
MYAEVILSKVTPKLDKVYHYSIPEKLEGDLKIGMQVLIPFGKRKDVGYVIGFTEKAEVEKTKDIIQILSPYPLFSESSLKVVKWMADYYNSFFITALRTIMPPGMLIKEKRALSEKRRKPLYEKRKQAAKTSSAAKKSELKPTEYQEKAMDLITSLIDEGKKETVLLYGVTGSGKTEVYLRSIEKVLEKGKTAIALVPEIGLTPLMIERFQKRFGDQMSLFHSDMSVKERAFEWNRMASGESRVVLGTRSAVFAPLENLGLIVIDEEFENTYKQEQNPRYNAKEVAQKLAEMNNAVVVLGTATPSIETFYKAKTGEYKMVSLPKRIDDRPLPPVEIVDMREELKSGNRGVLSSKLRKEIKSVLGKKKQIILFMNRRGYFTFVMCRECGHTVECPKCSVPLVFHMSDKKLRCGHCSFESHAPLICPKCQSSSIKFFGTGTQRIEKEVADVFPFVRIIRLDRDTVNKKGAYEKAIKVFAQGDADVLIGTQIVTKGLDLESVTLVAAVSADVGLNIPDFRATEHTFQLLTQVAGRAGRHFLPGEVIIQTYNPENCAIQDAAKHDYESFYEKEIEEREALNYPPFGKLINIIISNTEEEKVRKLAKDLKDMLSRRSKTFQILGPAKAYIPKLRGEYRYQMILKGKDMDEMRAAATESASKVVKLGRSRISLDIDPQSLI